MSAKITFNALRNLETLYPDINYEDTYPVTIEDGQYLRATVRARPMPRSYDVPMSMHHPNERIRKDLKTLERLVSEVIVIDIYREGAERPEDRTKLWQARHDAYWAVRGLRPGADLISTDVCVPISRLAECIVETKRDIAASHLVGSLVGHVGDGNFHIVFPVNPDDPADIREAERLSDRIAERALALGGTVSGEHGVGLGKRKFLAREHGESLEVMRAIKHALDPLGIMNPGKLLP